MALLNIPHPTRIPFIQWRWLSYVLSGVFIAFSLFFFAFKGLNYGIDFKGGVSVEIRLQSSPDLSDLRMRLGTALARDVSIQSFGSPQDLLIRIEKKDDLEGDGAAVLKIVKEVLPADVEYRQIETIGPKMGRELVRNGIVAVLASLIAMLGYIWFRFEWRFGIAAFFALLNDCLWVFGLFSIFRLEFNETAIVAFLITASYSINDTVVIFDRIRENKQKYQKLPLGEMINLSINETLSRTILTSATTLLALAILYLFGGPTIASFSLPIFFGIAVGTYSSICIASPLLMVFHKGTVTRQVNQNRPQ